MTTEAASLALSVERHDRDLDAEETELDEDAWEREWAHTYDPAASDPAAYDPFTED